MSVFPPTPCSGLLSLSLSSPDRAPPKPHNAAHCGPGGATRQSRLRTLLVRFREARFPGLEISFSEQGLFKTISTPPSQISTWIPWIGESLTKLCFIWKNLTFSWKFLSIHLFIGVEAIRWFSPHYGRRHKLGTRDSSLITVITAAAVNVQTILLTSSD